MVYIYDGVQYIMEESVLYCVNNMGPINFAVLQRMKFNI